MNPLGDGGGEMSKPERVVSLVVLQVATVHLSCLLLRIGSLDQWHEVATDSIGEFTRRSFAGVQRGLHPVSTHAATPRFVDSEKLSGHVVHPRRRVKAERECLQVSRSFTIHLVVLIFVHVGVGVDRGRHLRARLPVSLVENLLGDNRSNDLLGFPARLHQTFLRHVPASLQSCRVQQELARTSHGMCVVFQRPSNRARHRGDFREEHVRRLLLPQKFCNFLRRDNLQPRHAPVRRRQPRGHEHTRLRYCRGGIPRRRVQQELLKVRTARGGCARAGGKRVRQKWRHGPRRQHTELLRGGEREGERPRPFRRRRFPSTVNADEFERLVHVHAVLSPD